MPKTTRPTRAPVDISCHRPFAVRHAPRLGVGLTRCSWRVAQAHTSRGYEELPPRLPTSLFPQLVRRESAGDSCLA